MATQIGQLKYSVGFDVKKQDLNSLKTQLQQLSNFKISDIMKFNNTDRETAKRTLNDIRNEAQHVKDALSAAFNTKLNTVNIETFNKSLKQSGSSLQQVYNTFKQGGAVGQNAFRSLVTQVTTTNAQLKETHKFLDNIATTLANTVKWNIASGAVNSLSNSVQQAWGFVKNLDTSLNDIRIVTGKSADEMANFAIQANEAAQSLGKTTVDYTKAALIYAQQGLNDEQIAERAAITLKTANVTGQSADEVSEQLTSVWNGYKVSAEQTELYIDRLAAVAASTASDLEQLSTGMSKVAAAAAAMGVGEDQLAAQLSTIISVTRQAPESVGTALRTVYARISDIKAGIDEDGVTLGNYSGKMAELGFNVLDVNGKLRDMGQVIEDIGGRWQDLTREQQVSLAQTMAGQRQYSNLIALFDNFEEYNRALGIAQNAAGTLQKQQDVYMQSTRAHLNQLKAATEQLYNSLINPDALKPLIDGLATAATMGAKFIDSLGGGENLLLALGGIAVNVFSDQLTRGVQTFVHNFTLGNQQVELMKQNLATFDEVLNIQKLDDLTKGTIESFKQTELSLAKNATPEQFEKMNTILGSVTAAVNEYREALVETQQLEKQFQDAQKATGFHYKNMSQYLEKTSEQHIKFDTVLQHSSNGYDKAAAAANDFSKAVIQQNGNIKVTKDQIDALKQALQNINNQDFSIQGFERPKQEIDNVLKALEQIQQKDLDDSKYKEFVDKIQKHFQRLRDSTQITTTAIEQQVNNQDQATKNLKRNIDGADEGLKDIGNQEKIRAVGRLVGSFTQLATSVKITANAFNELRKGNISSGLTALATSLTSVTTAAVSAGKAVAALGASVGVATGIGAVVAAISLATSGLIAYNQAIQENRQAQIDLNNAIIENQHKNQEEIDKKQELLIAVKDLNEEYENGQITRADLRSEIDKLCDQYGIEETYIDDLIDKYGSLAEGIRQARIEAAKQKQDSLQTEFESTKRNVEQSQAGRKLSVGYTVTDLTDNTFVNLLSKFGAKIESQYDTWSDQFWSSLVLPKNIENRVDIYNALSTQLQKYKDDPLYNDLKKWYNDFSESAKKYNQIKEKLNSFLDYDIYSNQYADFENTKTFEEYRKQRQQLIDNVAKNNANDAQQVTKAVDKYLKNNYKGLYGQYDETLRYVDELEKRFNSSISKDILDSIKQLDAKHLNELQRLDASGIITSWEILKEAISNVADIDLSNIEKAADASAAAADNYTFFKSLEDQVRSGKSISSKEIDRFSDYGAQQLEQYFTMMANGQYKMTQDATKFFETVQKFELSGFYDQIQNLKNTEKQLFEFAKIVQQYNNDLTDSNTFNFQDLTQSSVSYNQRSKYGTKENVRINQFRDLNNLTNVDLQNELGVKRYEDVKQFNKELAEQQLQLLAVYKQQAGVLETTFNQWKTAVDTGNLSLEQAEAMANAIEKIGDKSENLVQNFQQTQEELKQIEQRLYDALNPIDSDINESTLFALTQTIRDVAGENNEFAESLQEDARASENLAEAILRFNDAIEDMVKNYESWHGILTSETVTIQQLAEVIQPLRDAYADLLDMDGSSLSNEFLQNVQNLQLMKQAIDGNIDSYNELKQIAAEDIIAHLVFDTDQARTDFENEFNSILEWMQGHKAEFQVGASFMGQEAFINSLTNLINATQMTADKAQDLLLNAFGINAEVIQETHSEPVKRTITGYDYSINYQKVRGTDPITRNDSTFVVPTAKPKIITEEITESVPAVGTALKILNANRSAGGEIKWKHSSQGAGYAGTTRRTKEAESAAKAAKTSEPKPDTSTKDTKDYKQDDRDIYHDINLQLDQITRQLSRAQKVQERLFGKQLIANLNKQSQILEQHKTKLKEKQKLQQLDLAQKREQLRLLGVIVNEETGNIDNYLDALGQRQGVINGLIAQYNSIVNSYNATTDKQAKDVIKDQLTEIERAIQDAETDYKNLESKIKNYDSLRKAYEDISDQIKEQTQKQIEIQITKFNMQVEIRLNMGQAERDWNKFKREVLEGTDVLKDTNFSKIYKDANLNYEDIYSYFDINGNNKGQIQTLTKQINETIAEINQINQTGISDIYGDNKAKALEDLQKHLSTIQESMTDVKHLIDEIDEAYLETYDDIRDQMQKQIDDYEFVNDLIEHDMDLLQLLYGDKQYDAMNSYYTQEHANQLNQIDFLRQSIALVKERWQMEEAAGNINAAEKLKEQYKDLVNDLNSLVEASVKTLQDKYENAISQIFDSLDRRVTNGLGLQYVDMEWQLLNKNADEYLDAINSAYALQELETKFQKAIDSTNNVKNQKAISSLMDQQLSKLRAKNKLTQYDVDRAVKLLEIQQARMELEERRTAKTSLRLKRDSQGNYSYVYTANEEEVEKAEDNLAKLQNELYNFDKQAYKDNLNDVLSAYKEFTQRYKQIYTDRSLDQADKERLLALLVEQYQEYITGKTEENYVIRQNLVSSAFDSYAELYDEDYSRFANMVESERDVFLGELVTGWNSGVQQMIDAFIGAGGLQEICTETFGELERVTKQYQSDLSDLQKAAGEDFGRIRQGAINPTTEAFKGLMTANDDLIRQFQNQLTDIENLRAALENLKNAYNDVQDAAKRAAEAAQQVLQKEREVAAQEAQNAARSKPQPVPEQKVSMPETPQVVTPAPVSTPTPAAEPTPVLTPQVESNKIAYDPWAGFTTTVKGIVGNIWYGGSWAKKLNTGNLRDAISKIFGNWDANGNSKDNYKQAKAIWQGVNTLWDNVKNGEYAPPTGLDYLTTYDYYELLKKYGYGVGTSTPKAGRSGDYMFDTGGYTGAWGSDGRWAVLHQKELVLNAQDTKNMLDSVEVLRGIVSNLGGNISARLNGLNGGYAGASLSRTSSQVDQNVSIQANFPNVNSKREIEEAFSELVNLAAQRAMRRV